MRKILPIFLALLGVGAGVGAGVMLKPEPQEVAPLATCGPESDDGHDVAQSTDHSPEEEADPTREYVKLNNQFVIPVVEGAKVTALVVLSLSLETSVGGKELVFKREPKIRDAFLQVLFDHANAGGFDGAFTQNKNMTILRNSLLEMARKTLGTTVSDVLISDIVRQDL